MCWELYLRKSFAFPGHQEMYISHVYAVNNLVTSGSGEIFTKKLTMGVRFELVPRSFI